MLVCDLQPRHNHRFVDYHSPSPSTFNKQSQHISQHKRTQSNRAVAAPTTSSHSRSATVPSYNFFEPVPEFESPSELYSQHSSLDDQYMSNTFNYQSPAIRVQQSTPTPGLQVPAGQQQQQQQHYQHSLPFDTTTYAQLLEATSYGGNAQMVATQGLHTSGMTRNRSHHRAPSASSIGSSGSASPYSQGHAAYPYAVSDGSPVVNTASKLGQQYNVDQSSRHFSNHLPTPTQTPTQDSFVASNFPVYTQAPIDSTVAAHLAMNQALDNTLNHEEELPGMSHSSRHSVSSLGQEPSTPRTIAGDVYDDGSKQPSHGEPLPMHNVDAWLDEYLQYDADTPRHVVPKFDRTMSDIYQDEIYNPTIVPQIQTQMASRPSAAQQYLSPHRNVITERLQAAQIARSQSPTSANSRGVSPFRPDSPYVQDPYVQASRYHTAAQVRQRQKQQADAQELVQSQHRQSQRDNTPKTISPKEAFLDYNETEEDSKMGPLFSENNSVPYAQNFSGAQQSYQTPTRSQFENNSNAGQTFGNIGSSTSRAETWPTPRRQSASGFTSTSSITVQPQTAYNFPSPTVSNLGGLPMPFSSQNYRSAATMPTTKQEETPDFPAHLTSMDSSASEAPPSSQNSNHTETMKPASSLADTGTYTCTYHGCTLRFETPQKLQKHKREGHRNPATSPVSPGASASATSASMTSAAILARNSQAGPHKCERINPTTGKPCNTIFSRPYDLTRHEDTIHNARKQKVRCALCVEEKTFSRSDALTRHMRVVHPEVDFPGKHRRRGAHD
jgi:hypothetical protein